MEAALCAAFAPELSFSERRLAMAQLHKYIQEKDQENATRFRQAFFRKLMILVTQPPNDTLFESAAFLLSNVAFDVISNPYFCDFDMYAFFDPWEMIAWELEACLVQSDLPLARRLVYAKLLGQAAQHQPHIVYRASNKLLASGDPDKVASGLLINGLMESMWTSTVFFQHHDLVMECLDNKHGRAAQASATCFMLQLVIQKHSHVVHMPKLGAIIAELIALGEAQLAARCILSIEWSDDFRPRPEYDQSLLSALATMVQQPGLDASVRLAVATNVGVFARVYTHDNDQLIQTALETLIRLCVPGPEAAWLASELPVVTSSPEEMVMMYALGGLQDLVDGRGTPIVVRLLNWAEQASTPAAQ
jgi:hypothetical protein